MATPFVWATSGGFVARTLDDPLSPGSNLTKSAFWASLFATKPGQRVIRGIGVRSISAGGRLLAGIFGTTAAGVVLGAGAGAVIGAALGTAISSVAFGEQGKEKAIDFYTGQSGAKWYEYIPHYNYGRIVRHYVVG